MKLVCRIFWVFFFLLPQEITHAQSIQQIDYNYFGAGIPSEEFEFMQAQSVNQGMQIQSNWCWAACIQMVLNYHGLKVNQTDVVTKIYGSPYVNAPANEPQILAALSGWAPDIRGRYSSIHASGGFTTVNELVNALAYKWPLIVGLHNPETNTGHAFVLTAVYYQIDRYGNPVPNKVILRDPWPGNASRREMSWQEFHSRCLSAIKVWINRW